MKTTARSFDLVVEVPPVSPIEVQSELGRLTAKWRKGAWRAKIGDATVLFRVSGDSVAVSVKNRGTIGKRLFEDGIRRFECKLPCSYSGPPIQSKLPRQLCGRWKMEENVWFCHTDVFAIAIRRNFDRRTNISTYTEIFQDRYSSVVSLIQHAFCEEARMFLSNHNDNIPSELDYARRHHTT